MSPKVDFRLDYVTCKITTPITEMWMQRNSWGRENVLTAVEVYESEIYICRIQVFLGLWVCLFVLPETGTNYDESNDESHFINLIKCFK